MKFPPLHPWPNTTEEASKIQEQLRTKVIREDQLNEVKYVAGIDVGYDPKNQISKAAVAILTFPDLQQKEHAIATTKTTFPYIPGYLSFREIPAVLEALEKLSIIPDLLLCDGQGIAHPRRFGLACHIGVLTNIPAIGVAKTRFIGEHDTVPEPRGSWQPLHDQSEIIGAVLRTRTATKPLYISIGHKITLTTALEYVLKCTPKYRLPETTRTADYLASSK
ncbi:MAG TPA: deoxyribonuclease V [Halomicronema sp.]